jgi:hypothetical protein
VTKDLSFCSPGEYNMQAEQIPFATDYSESTAHALSVAVMLARESDGLLLIAHVSDAEQYPVGELFDEEPTPDSAELNRLKSIVPSDFRVRHEHRLLYSEPGSGAITKPADGEGKFIRQSGGKGQYGHVCIKLEPNAEEYDVTFSRADLLAKMKADLAKKEPGLLEFWNQIGLYEKMLEKRKAAVAGRDIVAAKLTPPQIAEAQKLARFERETVERFDRVVWVTEEDRAAFPPARGAGRRDAVIPIAVDPAASQPIARQRPFRVTFLGGLHWPPNAEAVRGSPEMEKAAPKSQICLVYRARMTAVADCAITAGWVVMPAWASSGLIRRSVSAGVTARWVPKR